MSCAQPQGLNYGGEVLGLEARVRERVLERDGVVDLDPLEIAFSFDARDGEVWRRVAENPSHRVTCWALSVPGMPIRGFVLSEDLPNGRRVCVRFDVNGVELAKIDGPHVKRVDRQGPMLSDRITYPVNRLMALVEKVCGDGR